MLTMILAIDQNNLIGKTDSQNGLPWHYKEDLQFYKQNTIHKKNLMGRKTYEQIGKALPNRTTYVLTKNKNINYTDANMFYSLDNVIDFIKSSDDEIMLTGGVELFRQLFPYVDKILLTIINKNHIGDVYYNDLDLSNFKKTSENFGNNKDLIFQTWERK